MACEVVTQEHIPGIPSTPKPTPLTVENAVAKLHIFFDQYTKHGWGTLQPTFEFVQNGEQTFTATVTLPDCVSLRTVESPPSPRKKEAKARAALKALELLRDAGVTTADYLPSEASLQSSGIAAALPIKKKAIQECGPQLNPWTVVAASWKECSTLWETVISIRGESELFELKLFTPIPIPAVQPFDLFWSDSLTYRANISDSVPIAFSEERIQLLRRVSDLVLNSFHSQIRLTETSDYLILIGPNLPVDDLGKWCEQNLGSRPAERLQEESLEPDKILLRRRSKFGALYVFRKWLSETQLEALPFNKRRDFLHSGQWLSGKAPKSSESLDSSGTFEDVDPFNTSGEPQDLQTKAVVLDAADCIIDNVDINIAMAALFIPSFLHKIQVSLLADELRKTILSSIQMSDLQLLVSAISAPASYNDTNYQNLEFIGDSVLKYIVGVHIFFDKREASEGELVKLKDAFVSNYCLGQAAMDTGLDKYIATKQFTGKKWKPWTLSSIDTFKEDNRRIGMKVLADVVEALIGAAFLNGGFSNAVACAKLFLPEVQSLPREEQFNAFQPSTIPRKIPMLADLEQLLGYSFHNPALALEAMTHPSYKPAEQEIFTGDYQRLEYLGDTVLDMIVVKQFTKTDLLHWDSMHKWKSVCVNLEFLSFLCLEMFLTKEASEVLVQADGSVKEHRSVTYLPLYGFMRFTSVHIEESQRACMERHLRLRRNLFERLNHDSFYPWVEFDSLAPEKFYSDIIESLIGAVYIDSGGDLSQCELLIERFGILHYLRRFVGSKIECLHPKTRLVQWTGMFGRVNYKTGQDELGFWCTVTIDAQDKATCRGCLTEEEAISRAAEAALAGIGEKKAGSHNTQHATAGTTEQIDPHTNAGPDRNTGGSDAEKLPELSKSVAEIENQVDRLVKEVLEDLKD